MKDQPHLWRSLAEHDDPDAHAGTPEFEAPLSPPTSQERRRFLQLGAASVALAGSAGCRWKEDHLAPMAKRAEGVVPGVPRYFNTAMELGGAAVGLRVKSYDGRPIKVDGNASHPDSLGATRAWHQATLLELYDPDRASAYTKLTDGKRESASELEFRIFAREQHRLSKQARGKGLVVLAGVSSSPSRADLKRRLLERLPEARWFEHEPAAQRGAEKGAELAFGARVRSLYRLQVARVVVSIGADVLGARTDSLALARAWAARRDPKSQWMNRTYAFESSMSETGAAADHRVPMRSEHLKALVAHLDHELSKRVGAREGLGPAQPSPGALILREPSVKKIVDAMMGDLLANRGASLVVVGDDQPPEVHAIAHRINALLDNVDHTVVYAALPDEPPPAGDLSALVQAMNAGEVETLLVLDSNPAYTAPADVDFEGALAKVKTKIVCSLYLDETARHADWHVPLAHYLEAWGDVRATDGTISIQQPLIEPLHGGKSVIEVLALMSRDNRSSGEQIVRRTSRDLLAEERAWRRAVHDGVVAQSAYPVASVALKPLPTLNLSPEEKSGPELENGQLELTLAPDPRVFDGRFGNNGWLQELPEATTKLTWDNALLVSPKNGRDLGLKDGGLAKLSIGDRSATVPVLFAPGQASGALKLHLGFGRTAAGRVGGQTEGEDRAESVGVNAYALRSSSHASFARGARVEPVAGKARLATTQDKHVMDRIGKFGTDDRLPMLVRQASLEEYREHPDFAAHRVHHPPLLSLWKEPVKYDGHKWGMSIDLNKCIGCSGCVVACQAENNIPVVGKERVAMGREMHWLRIDRYFQGDPEQPEVSHQPVPCMQCEHAPCEQVCPVGATMHSSEGLNDMTYNRCIGTRYCSNNCPYKVRRFNYFNFHEDMKEEKNQVKGMVFNPEVTVRFRGVMEKCSYCVQRIQEGKYRAGRENRPLEDGEITTACQDSCPTQAIVFGDLNDGDSKVTANKRDPRDYSLLQELNVRPRTTYMAKVKNPHPELV